MSRFRLNIFFTIAAMMLAISILPAGSLPGSSGVAHAAPEPEPVPRRWELRVEMGDLRVATVNLPDKGPRTYYYLTFRVTNNTGQDLYFAPTFDLFADDGEIYRGGRGIPRVVTESILRKIDNEFLEDQFSIQGNLLQGEENAREGLIIWPANNLEVDEVVVFAAGFSGETRTITRPDTGETVVLRKSLMLRHAVPGEINPNSTKPLKRTMRRWILR